MDGHSGGNTVVVSEFRYYQRNYEPLQYHPLIFQLLSLAKMPHFGRDQPKIRKSQKCLVYLYFGQIKMVSAQWFTTDYVAMFHLVNDSACESTEEEDAFQEYIGIYIIVRLGEWVSGQRRYIQRKFTQ